MYFATEAMSNGNNWECTSSIFECIKDTIQDTIKHTIKDSDFAFLTKLSSILETIVESNIDASQ